ncbi:DUF7573 domain-containing protein [Salinadaptatus halalkaliphilus]|uniref:DUF7573 domain-containing protein n=1 Tax=Salinadaptatus halalkaliphilus TaxID=2419781 RepID=UPI001FECD1D5|nr:hypothetical protein [Salinadaptatus halalkaliphilus]
MTEDASLTDFTGPTDGDGDSDIDEHTADRGDRDGDEGIDPASGNNGEIDPNDGAGSSDDDGPREPLHARATYGWGEFRCQRCDRVAQRVWRDGDETVCPACKAW